RTKIGLIDTVELWQITGIVIVVAVVGKFVGSALAAKYVGQSWRDSLTIGALMNTRGLMELIVLNIGKDLGVLDDRIFAILVIMALVTTFMTGPALDLINWMFKKRENVAQHPSDRRQFKLLFPFDDPDRGKALLRLANSFVKKEPSGSVTALHLTMTAELHTYYAEQQEKDT